MLTIFSINNNNDIRTIHPIWSRFLTDPRKLNVSPSDGRIMNLNIPKTINKNGTNIIVNTVYVCGVDKCDLTCRNTPSQASIEDRGNCNIIINPQAPVNSIHNGEMVPGIIKNKQGLSRIQILYNTSTKQFSCSFPNQIYQAGERDPFNNIELCTQGALANCISWDGCTEKNYVLHYFNYENEERIFCPVKCIILQFDMTVKQPNTEGLPYGMVFYFKQFDANINNNNINEIYDGKIFETEMDRTWRLIITPNSDVFTRITTHFLNDARNSDDDFFRFSCTTPFIEIDNSLFSVGHLKIKLFDYINQKLEQTKGLFGLDYEKIKQYYNSFFEIQYLLQLRLLFPISFS